MKTSPMIPLLNCLKTGKLAKNPRSDLKTAVNTLLAHRAELLCLRFLIEQLTVTGQVRKTSITQLRLKQPQKLQQLKQLPLPQLLKRNEDSLKKLDFTTCYYLRHNAIALRIYTN
jgi:hypothetical protein